MNYPLIPDDLPRWQCDLAEAFRDVEALCQYLELSPEQLPELDRQQAFALRVPRGFAARMQKGNPHDPLLRQVLPLVAENVPQPGFTTDPVGDLAAVKQPGVLHKYDGRVLWVAHGGCAVHCRYCFRRHFPYNEQRMNGEAWQAAVDYLQRDESLHEVIVSGGDPLLLSDRRWGALVEALAAIPHLKRLRIHSRIPVVLPSRVTSTLLERLTTSRLPLVMVLHANHPTELNGEVAQACLAMRGYGITLLNQTVLLREVNDDATVLRALSERLFEIGVLPYYLHQLDPAAGTGHFAVTLEQAQRIMRQLRETLPGYLVPRWVQERAGARYKWPLG